MKIRPAESSDRLRIADVITKSYATVARRYGLTGKNCPKHPSNCSVEWIERDMERGVHYTVIESDEEIVGCMALEPWVC
jgi:N-acetylglutamate synthase-like GNAT family acetyltransferase